MSPITTQTLAGLMLLISLQAAAEALLTGGVAHLPLAASIQMLTETLATLVLAVVDVAMVDHPGEAMLVATLPHEALAMVSGEMVNIFQVPKSPRQSTNSLASLTIQPRFTLASTFPTMTISRSKSPTTTQLLIPTPLNQSPPLLTLRSMSICSAISSLPAIPFRLQFRSTQFPLSCEAAI